MTSKMTPDTAILEDFINVVYDMKSNLVKANTTSLELINYVLSNDVLLNVVANRTSLSVEYINRTLQSVLDSAEYIAGVYKLLNSTQEGFDDTTMNMTNVTVCRATINPNNLMQYSFIPAIIIILILSMVNTRVWRKKYCGGKPGIVIPVNLLDSFENRFFYAFAFGATASRIVKVILLGDYSSIFGDGYEETQSNTKTTSALLKIGASLVVGISYYPFFSCISTHQRLLGAVLGTIYSAIWFCAYVVYMIDCGASPAVGWTKAENVLVRVPEIVCHGFLLLCFIGVLVRSLISKKRGIVITKQEWKENYKYNHVKDLLKPIPKSAQTIVTIDGFKHKITSNVYKWKTDFKYSTRMVCIYLTACICLYLVIINYAVLGRDLNDFYQDTVDGLSRIDSPNTSVNWSRIKEAGRVCTVCWVVAIAVAFVKELIMMGNMVSWYRGHVFRLQRGDRSFLPVNIDRQKPTGIMVASFKFAGYQVGYIVWGFIITQIAIFLILSVLSLGLIWPLTWGGVEDSIILSILASMWVSLAISLLTVLLQTLMAKYIFLRDFGATLALNNRRLFHVASYFLFFLNIIVGLISCLIRIFYAVLFGALFLPRLQKSTLPKDWELFDPGYKTYIGYLYLEHTHTNPVLVTFSQLVLDAVALNKNDVDSTECILQDIRGNKKARNRWFVAITLINNPELRVLRRQEKSPTKQAFSAIKDLALTLAFKMTSPSESVETKF